MVFLVKDPYQRETYIGYFHGHHNSHKQKYFFHSWILFNQPAGLTTTAPYREILMLQVKRHSEKIRDIDNKHLSNTFVSLQNHEYIFKVWLKKYIFVKFKNQNMFQSFKITIIPTLFFTVMVCFFIWQILHFGIKHSRPHA